VDTLMFAFRGGRQATSRHDSQLEEVVAGSLHTIQRFSSLAYRGGLDI
jgi:hypothetical protein